MEFLPALLLVDTVVGLCAANWTIPLQVPPLCSSVLPGMEDWGTGVESLLRRAGTAEGRGGLEEKVGRYGTSIQVIVVKRGEKEFSGGI